MTKPLLSIGMIFKNEIRCLERCLKSLQPLRDAVPCELVMADTGATDGSRQVAEKYADILFDFAWIGDFSAARNAVMDHCSGKWYLSIDCDEWLGGDAQEIADLVRDNKEFRYAGITVRNYKDALLEKSNDYTDFTACRLMRMSTGLRYVGKIHERWPSETDEDHRLLWLQRCLLHHDGYLHNDPVVSREKLERNMAPLKELLEKDPKNLVALLQCIESSAGTPENIMYVRKAVQGIKEQWEGWSAFGPPILRYAAVAAFRTNDEELEPCIDAARKLFPTSMYTRIDVEFAAFGLHWQRNEYQACIESGQRYLSALADHEAGNYNPFDSLCSTLAFVSLNWKQQVQIFMAASYLYEKQPRQTRNILKELDGKQMTVKHVADCIRVYTHLHSQSFEDTEPLITKLWDEICQPTPSEERAAQREKEFIRMGSEVFLPAYQEDEKEKPEFCRPAHKVFLPLEGRCLLGDMAAVLDTGDTLVMENILRRQEHCDQFPAVAMFYALEHGIRFPLPDRLLNVEEMDALASRLAQDMARLIPLALDAAERVDRESWQAVCWSRGLLLAAVRAYPWAGQGQDEGQGIAIARAFGEIEGIFLPMCYGREALSKGHLFVLPPLHRFGWYCTQAFDALNVGDTVGYVRLLREGLAACEGTKDMVEFLIDNTPGLKTPSEDLKSMAEQIRAVLARFSPEDPAVAALKQSEAYQKVAYLIEGTAPPITGGLLQ